MSVSHLLPNNSKLESVLILNVILSIMVVSSSRFWTNFHHGQIPMIGTSGNSSDKFETGLRFDNGHQTERNKRSNPVQWNRQEKKKSKREEEDARIFIGRGMGVPEPVNMMTTPVPMDMVQWYNNMNMNNVMSTTTTMMTPPNADMSEGKGMPTGLEEFINWATISLAILLLVSFTMGLVQQLLPPPVPIPITTKLGFPHPILTAYKR